MTKAALWGVYLKILLKGRSHEFSLACQEQTTPCSFNFCNCNNYCKLCQASVPLFLALSVAQLYGSIRPPLWSRLQHFSNQWKVDNLPYFSISISQKHWWPRSFFSSMTSVTISLWITQHLREEMGQHLTQSSKICIWLNLMTLGTQFLFLLVTPVCDVMLNGSTVIGHISSQLFMYHHFSSRD